ncbi:MAG: WXG100 family type VII secretion target [Oscillospiraceae bacterium]|nr:WXG100 family type VII secretion target [Oscillospiraceae bacterium]
MNLNRQAQLDEMYEAARNISAIAEEYNISYRKIYSITNNDLKNAWVGQDSDSFISKMNSVQVKFEKMYDIMIDYKQFILDAATRYEQQMNENKDLAQKLDF